VEYLRTGVSAGMVIPDAADPKLNTGVDEGERSSRSIQNSVASASDDETVPA
jgi:hypothetical protein